MKTVRNHLPLIILFLCLLGLPVSAQTGKFYSTNNELSSSLINQIFQDERGFIWIATEYGLNKFDGLRFSNYKHISGDSTSIKITTCARFLKTMSKTCWWAASTD